MIKKHLKILLLIANLWTTTYTYSQEPNFDKVSIEEGNWDGMKENIVQTAQENKAIEFVIRLERTELTDDESWQKVIEKVIACHEQLGKPGFFIVSAELMLALNTLNKFRAQLVTGIATDLAAIPPLP